MSDYSDSDHGRGLLCGVALGLSLASIMISIRKSRDSKEQLRQQKIEQETIKEKVLDSLQNTIEYQEAVKAYEKMVRKKQEIEKSLNVDKPKS